jgi:hypothetical protein
LEGGSARRKVATYIQNNTNTEYTHRDIHASSGVRTQTPVFEQAKTVHASDRAATVIGMKQSIAHKIHTKSWDL